MFLELKKKIVGENRNCQRVAFGHTVVGMKAVEEWGT